MAEELLFRCSLQTLPPLPPSGSRAVAEELLFRGFLQTALRQRLGAWDGAALSGALFAAMHLSVEQFFGLCVLGCVAGWYREASGSVVPAIALHATYNVAALVAAAAATAAH